jgi:hypothetical protein
MEIWLIRVVVALVDILAIPILQSLREVINRIYLFYIWFVVESIITVRSMNIVLGHTIKNT